MLAGEAAFTDISVMNARTRIAAVIAPVALLVGCSANEHAGEPAPVAAVPPIPETDDQIHYDPFVDTGWTASKTFVAEWDDDGLPPVPDYRGSGSELTFARAKAELEFMADLDHDLLEASMSHRGMNDELNERIRQIDEANAARLREIVRAFGWPTVDAFGIKAAKAAFLVVQHAGHDTEFQNEALGMMVDLVSEGDLPAPYLALLTDRIRLFKGEDQLFGTQMKFEIALDGSVRATPSIPIEDPERLDDRRGMMGLVPHRHFIAHLEEQYDRQYPGAPLTTVETWRFQD